MKKTISIFSLSVMALTGFSQDASLERQWQNADASVNNKIGVSTEEALKHFKSPANGFSPVVVAIIDSGTETSHPDLANNLWTNKGEVPNNGIDDDKNGYVDDVHGWSFIGGKNGDVEKDNMEFIRVYKMYRVMFSKGSVPGKEKEYEYYQKLEKDYQTRLANAQGEFDEYQRLSKIYYGAKAYFLKNIGPDYTAEEVANFTGEHDSLEVYRKWAKLGLENNFDKVIPQWGDHVTNQLKFGYDLNFDPRGVVGDNYDDVMEMIYGNNHIDGPAADHGTHVAGIVGATRNNGLGMDGICPSAQLMIIRCVPDGDERDKDVANAIFYAVNNGAKVINMSFGKAYSPFKSRVDEAVKFAESKGVLLVHAAGNDNKNVDEKDNFPKALYTAGGKCSTWIEVGASGNATSELKADFSNYGKKSVDVFAPGVEIYSCVPGHKYEAMSGTSMASPVTAGVAACILAYYPQLTGAEVKALIEDSAVSYKNVKVPVQSEDGKVKKVKFKKFSKTGSVVNLYKALELAEKRYGKK